MKLLPDRTPDPITPLNVEAVSPGIGFVYRWLDTVNGKMYIGSHDGNNPRYRASGRAINKAFTKYGHNQFVRQFLYVGPDHRVHEEYFLKLVDAMHNPMYYNMMNTAIVVGSGVDNPMYGRSGVLSPVYGRTISEYQRQRLSETHKDKIEFQETRDKKRVASTGENNPNYGKKMSEDQKRKISESRIERGVAVGDKNPNYGKPRPESVKAKLREANLGKKQEIVTCPHCPKVGGISGMKSWHFDKCKQKRERSVSA